MKKKFYIISPVSQQFHREFLVCARLQGKSGAALLRELAAAHMEQHQAEQANRGTNGKVKATHPA